MEHLKYWEGDRRGIFNDTGEFATFVVDSFGNHEIEFFPALFETIERIINEGDESARAAVTVGVLESIQTISSNREFGFEPFEQWLKPQSLKFWKDTSRLWEIGEGSLAGVIRKKKKSSKQG